MTVRQNWHSRKQKNKNVQQKIFIPLVVRKKERKKQTNKSTNNLFFFLVTEQALLWISAV
jgi:hypothetical protein